jgi:dolichol-phosphate mannosyltransferase
MTPVIRRHSRFCRFILVGLLGTVLQVSLLYLLTRWFRVSSVAATSAAVEITVLHNFVWHERFTWRDRAVMNVPHTALRLLRFHGGNGLLSLAGNTALMYFLIDHLRAPVVPSAIGAIVLCSLANFLLADHWVYAARSA